MKKSIHIQYFAILREKSGTSVETLITLAATPQELYTELKAKYHFSLDAKGLRVAVNNAFADWNVPLNNDDTVVLFRR